MGTPSYESINFLLDGLVLDTGPFDAVHHWKMLPECDEFVGARRSKHTMVAYDDGLYVFGGDNGRNMLNDLLRFDVQEKSWGRAFAVGTPPAPRYHHSAVVYNDSMFIFGGYTGDIHSNSNLTNKNDLFEYKFNMAQWVEWKFTGDMPVARSAHGAAVFNGKLWIFAGYDGNARLNDMWTVSLTSGDRIWEQVDQKGERPPTCCNFPVSVARNCMYVFSGHSGAKITNSLFEFNFKTNVWARITTEKVLRAAPPPPARRYGHTMVAYDGHLYVFGGTADATLSNDLHAFDLDTQTWKVDLVESKASMPNGRLFHAAAVVKDGMYVFGGTVDNNIRSGEMYRFQFENCPKCTLRDDFGKLLNNAECSNYEDVCFIVGKTCDKIYAHIPLISARCAYLKGKIKEAKKKQKEMIAENDEKGISEIVDLDEISTEILEVKLPSANWAAFKMVLDYIYTDAIDPSKYVDGNESDSEKIILVRVMDVYQLSLEFQLTRLQYLCVQFLNSTICLNNIIEALKTADKLRLDFIKDQCFRFIVTNVNFHQVVMSDEFETLDSHLLVQLVRRKQTPTAKAFTDPPIDLFKYSLQYDMKQFLEEGSGTDVDLIVDGHRTSAHKAILVARCGYFEARFRSCMPSEPNNVVNIKIGELVPSKESFQALMRYIYYGETKMLPHNSLYLFATALFFNFTNLRLHICCKYNLERNITRDTVSEVLEAADKIQAPEMRKYAMNIILENLHYVVRQKQFKQLDKELILEILQAYTDALRR